MSTDDTRHHARPEAERGSYGGGLGRAVVFVMLIAALGFVLPFAWVVDKGILEAASTPTPKGGGVDAGGAGWFLQEVAGVIVLGMALAAAAAWTQGRNRRKDAVGEAATAMQYDAPDRRTADDDPDRAPGDRPSDVRHGERAPDQPRG